jgi:hypothetical protein
MRNPCWGSWEGHISNHAMPRNHLSLVNSDRDLSRKLESGFSPSLRRRERFEDALQVECSCERTTHPGQRLSCQTLR